MKKTKQETDFFRYFDHVEIVDVPTEPWERYVIKDMSRYTKEGDAE